MNVVPSKPSTRGPVDVDVCLGNIVRSTRESLGVSQKYVADKIGVAYQQMQKYEVGINRITVGRLYQIANALDVAVETLLPPTCPDSKPGTMLKPDELHLIRCYRGLSERQRASVLNVISDMQTA